jgi:hypothetical protein
MPAALTNNYAYGVSGVCLWIRKGNREERKEERRKGGKERNL